MKQPALVVVRAALEDCPACAALLVEQMREHHIEIFEQPLAKVLETAVSDPSRGVLLVAKEARTIIGVAYLATILSAEHSGPIAWLEELYVSPQHRNQGVGSALMEAVLGWARESKLVALELEVDFTHERVISLYKRLGFKPLKRSRWVRKLGT